MIVLSKTDSLAVGSLNKGEGCLILRACSHCMYMYVQGRRKQSEQSGQSLNTLLVDLLVKVVINIARVHAVTVNNQFGVHVLH